MHAMYGKGRVGHAVMELAKEYNIEMVMVDDADEHFRHEDYEVIIPTPGVNPHSRAYSGGNTMSELDFSYQFLPRGFKIIAITGTDGKSSVTWMVYNFLKHAYGEDRVFISGNFEDSFAKTVTEIHRKGLTE